MRKILPEPSPRKGGARSEPDVQTIVPLPGKGLKKPQQVKDHEERAR